MYLATTRGRPDAGFDAVCGVWMAAARRYGAASDSSSTAFLIKVKNACSIHIINLLTGNGTQFRGRFTSKQKHPVTGNRSPAGKHVFDVLRKDLAIEHRFIPPCHPQTNRMVERFNGRISNIVGQTRFCSSAELVSTLRNHLKLYNNNIRQRALDHKMPIQAPKERQDKKPELFIKRVYNQACFDS